MSIIYLKEFNDSNNKIKHLEDLQSQCQDKSIMKDVLKMIEKELRIEKAGKHGESNVDYELRQFPKNMYILYDTYFINSSSDNDAQIDFIAITNNYIYLIEVKYRSSQYGNCYREKNGDIIYYKLDEQQNWEKDGQYPKVNHFEENPFVQSNRHRLILTDIMNQNPFLKKYSSRLRDIIVFANRKGYIYEKDLKAKNLILTTNLINYLMEFEKKNRIFPLLKKNMKKIGQTLYDISDKNERNYTTKIDEEFKKLLLASSNNKQMKPLNDDELKEALIKYRNFQLNETGYSPVGVFTLSSIDELIIKRPKTIAELKKIKGFGDKNTPKYGNDILEIINGNIPDYE